jgi:hypothetical protein
MCYKLSNHLNIWNSSVNLFCTLKCKTKLFIHLDYMLNPSTTMQPLLVSCYLGSGGGGGGLICTMKLWNPGNEASRNQMDTLVITHFFTVYILIFYLRVSLCTTVRVKVSVSFIEHHTMKTYEGVEVQLHAFLTLAVVGGDWSVSRLIHSSTREW